MVGGKTRISGTIRSYQWSIAKGSADIQKVVRTKVQIIGNGQTFEAVTNEDGVYEIYDLPPGTYTVRPEVPKGWKIDEQSPFGGFGSGRREDDQRSQVPLQARRQAYFDFFFQVDNSVRGRVTDPSGGPLQSVCVELLPTQTKVSEEFKRAACTDKDGRFEIDEVPFASYVIIVNKDNKISSRQPFRQFYYPRVAEREKAQVITIKEGDPGPVIDISVPAVNEVVTIDGTVLSSDGVPVVSANVNFTATTSADETIDGSAFARTDDNGKFSIRILKGFSGELFANVRLEPNAFKNCPTLLQDAGKTRVEWKTNAIGVQAHSSMDNLELRLPVSSCKQTKIVSRMRVD
jgi:Carboxypeptidase regulatory-like domain